MFVIKSIEKFVLRTKQSARCFSSIDSSKVSDKNNDKIVGAVLDKSDRVARTLTD